MPNYFVGGKTVEENITCIDFLRSHIDIPKCYTQVSSEARLGSHVGKRPSLCKIVFDLYVKVGGKITPFPPFLRLQAPKRYFANLTYICRHEIYNSGLSDDWKILVVRNIFKSHEKI